MRKKISAESVAIVAVGVALAGLVQVRFSGIEKQMFSLRQDVSDLAERVSRVEGRMSRVEGILAAEFGYVSKSESPDRSVGSRVAEVVPPS